MSGPSMKKHGAVALTTSCSMGANTTQALWQRITRLMQCRVGPGIISCQIDAETAFSDASDHYLPV